MGCCIPEEKPGTCTCYVSPDFLDHANGVVQSLIGLIRRSLWGNHVSRERMYIPSISKY